MSKGVKLALVGCGGISGAHLVGYRDLHSRGCRDFEVTACCDVSEQAATTRAEEIAAYQGSEPAVFTDVGDLVKAGVSEAADVCLPHWLHHGVGTALIEGGMHVLIEKPIGITVRASKQIIEAGNAHGKVVAVAEQVRRNVGARSCEWAINEEKMIGDVHTVHARNITDAPFDYTNPAMIWRGFKITNGGGMIMDSGAHFADMMVYLFGDVVDAYCVMETLDDRMVENVPVIGSGRVDVEDTWSAVIRFKRGTVINWSYSRQIHGDPDRSGIYYGTEGTMVDPGNVMHPFQTGGDVYPAGNGAKPITARDLQVMYLANLPGDEKDRLFPYGSTNCMGIEVWDFVEAIATGRKPEMDGTDGLVSKTLCVCCFESATAGEVVRFDDVLEGKIEAYQKPINDHWGL
ncbi:MAG: Gfo/Idh/MocA family oxidoreductase [Candidatus Latescibacteria bacterium]|jgi:predicted dehydrogenase|nr:Gfo/Idh/MocA family oxidoreductase [Candidatus Latescibacterota bacterium]